MPTRRLRLAIAVAAGLIAGGTAWMRLAPIEPSLDIRVRRLVATDAYAVYELRVQPRGGETIDRVVVESASPGTHLPRGTAGVRDLRPEVGTVFRVQVDGPAGTPGRVRVVQEDRVRREYDVPLPGDATR